MSSVLDRSALEQSPLADLHLLANELGVDGFRRLRKAELIDAILARQSGDDARAAAEADAEAEATPRPRRRGRRAAADGAATRRRGRRRAEAAAPRRAAAAAAAAASARRSGRRPTRTPATSRAEPRAEDQRRRGRRRAARQRLRLPPPRRRPRPTDDDVYISAAQVKRCELVSGDRIAGPVRAAAPLRALPVAVRVDTINGRPADEVAEGTRFEDLPVRVARPSASRSAPRTRRVKAIEWLTPFGKGSRVVIAGAAARRQERGAARGSPRARRAARASRCSSCSPACARRRSPTGPGRAPAAALTFAASPDAQAQAVEQAIEQGRRVAARGGDAVVLSTRSSTSRRTPPARALAAARNIADGGSLTVIATAPAPLGGETTVDRARRAADRAAAASRRSTCAAQRHAAPGAAGRRGGRRGDRQGARRGRCERRAEPPARRVRDPAPVRLGRELDRLAVALGLDVAEGVRGVVEDDVELALLDALVEPGGAEDEPAQPVHERAVGRADELRPAVVDVLAERRGRVLDLAVDGEVDEVLELGARSSRPPTKPSLRAACSTRSEKSRSLKVKRSSPYSRT